MKKQNKNIFSSFGPSKKGKRERRKLIKFSLIFLGLSVFLYVFANDIMTLISRQSATTLGSNNAQVTFSYTGWGETYYVEKGGNSTIIGNYLKGYYYDSMMWFFQLDWSSNTSKNVSIIDSTSMCSSSYGYKLGWYARNPYYGFIDFDYDTNTFVYYCEWDKKLHWYGYNKYVWFQSFEGIGFELYPWTGALLGTTSSDLFVNDTTTINQKNVSSGSNSNYSNSGIWGDIFNIDDTKESVIYIIH